MNHKISIFTAVTLMSFMISSNSIPASAGVVCKSMVWGEAFSPSKPMARIKARMAWKANAGPGWNNTALAKQKSRDVAKNFKIMDTVLQNKNGVVCLRAVLAKSSVFQVNKITAKL